MPKDTDRLNLPLPLGNENVTRESINTIFEKIDAGVATQADLDTLREAVSKMDIPDASLTQKGKVQLSNKTDGTSETVAATEKAVRDARVAAETSAKTYSETNFRKPAQINRANLVKNGSALMAFDYWVPIAGNWAVYSNPTVGYFWSQDGAISEGQYAVLDSNTIAVYPGTHFLQAMFHTVASGANSLVLIEIKNASTDVTINSLSADRNTWWHRKGMSFNVPEGVSAIKLRLVVSNYPGGSNMGFSRIVLNEGNSELPYSQEGDIRALYEQNQVVKQAGVDAKKGIVDAINAMGSTASIDDNWNSLKEKIKTIKNKARTYDVATTLAHENNNSSITLTKQLTTLPSINDLSVINFQSNMYGSVSGTSIVEYYQTNNAAEAYVELVDSAGKILRLATLYRPYSFRLSSFTADFLNGYLYTKTLGYAQYTGSKDTTVEENRGEDKSWSNTIVQSGINKDSLLTLRLRLVCYQSNYHVARSATVTLNGIFHYI